MQYLIGIWVFIIGACIGSFLNVVIIRGLKNEQIISGRSHCTTCDYELKWYDNIPIISYIMLGGKCRKCKEHISLQYPLVEAGNAACWLILYLKYGFSVATVLYMISVSSMFVISIVDLKIKEIPSTHNLIILICGVLLVVTKSIQVKEAILGALVVSLFLLAVYLFCLIVLSLEAIGEGDIKLEFAIGLCLGLKLTVTGFYIGCILAIIIHSLLRLLKIKGFESNMLPFGPYLCLGAFIALIYGNQIADKVLLFLGF